MFEQIDHHKIVRDTLAGHRAADEQTLASIAVLEERLDRLKMLGARFEGVGLAPAIKNLAARIAVRA
jgi:hypothetical protein